MSKSRWPWILLVSFVLMVSAFLFLSGIVMLALSGDDSRSGDIVVVELKGQIVDTQETVRELEELAEDKDVKAVVMRINSPGGLVSPSQELYQALLRLREQKPVIASLGSVAASGGYYVACGAQKIVANPGSITGSIGVRMDHVNMERLIELTRVEPQVLTSGRYKDLGSPLRPLRPDEELLLRNIIQSLYDQFKQTVGKERKLEGSKLDQVSDGRVFTGTEALAKGLVDQLGGLHDAVELAAELAGISGKPDVSYPRSKRGHWIDLVFEEASESLLRIWEEKQSTPRALWQL